MQTRDGDAHARDAEAAELRVQLRARDAELTMGGAASMGDGGILSVLCAHVCACVRAMSPAPFRMG